MTRQVELLFKNTSGRVNILVVDADGVPTAASDGPHLTVTNTGDTVLHRDSFPLFTLSGTVTVGAGQTLVTGTSTKFLEELDVGDTVTIAAAPHVVSVITSDVLLTLATPHVAGAAGATATKPTRIVNPAVGQYYILWGDAGAPANVPSQTETAASADYLFQWQVTGALGSEQQNIVQVAKVISARTARLLPYMRLTIDKAALMVSDDPMNPCYLGYTDAQLIQWLEQGLHDINAYEPYPIWGTVDQYPFDTFGSLLLDAGLIRGVMSQQLFAIATDVPNFSDQGNSFVIQHAPQLAAYLNQVAQRLDKLIPLMKLKYVQSGALHIEAGTNFRIATLLATSPAGALYRGIYFTGG